MFDTTSCQQHEALAKFAQELKLMQHLTQSWQLALQQDPGPLTHGPRWRRPPLQALALFLYSYLLDSIHLLDLLSMCFQYAFISYDSYPSCTMINFDRKSLTLHILQDPNVHSSVAITPIADAWNLSFESLDTWNRIAETILKFKAIREDETHLVPISGQEVCKQCPTKVSWQAFYLIDIQIIQTYSL